MKININYIDSEILISSDKVLAFEVENRNYFYRLVKDLNNISQGGLSESINFYDNDGRELNLCNKINIIIDYFNIDFNSKKILSMLYKTIKDNIDEEAKVRINSYYNKIKNIISKALVDFDLSLSVNDEYELDTIFKLLKISINNKDSLLDNMLLLIDLENLFKIDELLIFINVKQYLSKEELIELYKYSLYNNVKILLIDSQSYGVTLENEKKLIIDSNLDEFLV